MRAIALIDATTRLPELCESVERTGEPVQITSHGRPVAVISPWREPADRPSVWAAREDFERRHGQLNEDFELPARTDPSESGQNPLD